MALLITSSVVDAEQFVEAIAGLRRALHGSARGGHPWDWPPLARMELLQVLTDQPGTGLNELSDRLHMASAAVFRLVRDLRVYGLVEWAVGSTGGHVEVVSLTEEGRRQLVRWRSVHQRRIADALDRLPPCRQHILAHALPVLTELAEHLAADHKTRS